MKKMLLLLAMLIAAQFSYAQTNTFPTGGNVGIGTTSPTTLLDVYNSANSSTTLVRISGTGEANGNYTGLLFGAGGLQGRGKGAIIYEPYGTSYGLGRLHFAVNGSPGEGEATLSDIRMTILGNGNVGIGTTSPAAPLDIESSANSSWATQIINNGTTNAHGLYVNIGSGSTGIPFRVDVNGSDMFQVSNNGNVAIGTTDSQGHKLAVNGDIIATKITVKPYGSWPDYVFKPQYKLPTLSEVKTYIDQNQHLPDMPSEKEVAKDGVDLGEIVKLQTKKIEELTLYVIKLQEQSDQFGKELQELKDKK